MLTKNDLDQLRDILKIQVEAGFGAVRRDLLVLKMAQVDTQKKLSKLEKSSEDLVKQVQRGFKRMDTKLIKLFDFLDRDWSELQKRTKRIEQELNLPPLS